MRFVLFLHLTYIYYSVTAQNSFPALILVYDGKKFDMVDLPSIQDHQSLELLMLTCPAPDGKLNENLDWQTENSLMIETIHHPPFAIKNDKICENQYSPNILYDDVEKFYAFGYKFYINNEQLKIISTTIGLEVNIEEWTADSWNEMKTRLVPEEKNFYWYFVTEINEKSNSVTSEYIPDANRYVGDFKNCENFDLGFTFVEDEYIAKAYEKENQNLILNKYMKPKLRGEENEKMHLIEQQLTPIDDFVSYHKRLATCSYLNTAPMWNTIANGGWRRVEEFIKNLAGSATLIVTTGTFGQLELYDSDPPHFIMGVYLRNIHVPEGFWKFVTYYESDEDGSEIRRGIVIFTLNYISGTMLHQPLCEENVCKKFGWNVENDDYRTGFTYCCRADDEVLSKLEQNTYYDYNDLNLRELHVQV